MRNRAKIASDIIDLIVESARQPLDRQWAGVSKEMRRAHGPSANNTELVPGFPATRGELLLYPGGSDSARTYSDPSPGVPPELAAARRVARAVSKMAADMAHATNDVGERPRTSRGTGNPADGVYDNVKEREVTDNIRRGFATNLAADVGSGSAPLAHLNTDRGDK